MKKIFGPMAIIVTVLLAICVLSSVYIVSETEQVVLTQFGEPVGDSIQSPGLYFKLPLIQQARYYDDRIIEWDGDANRVPTKDKKYIWIDTTARWRIVDPLQFMQKVMNVEGAQQRLDAILDGTTRNVIADRMLIEIVRSSNRILELSSASKTDQETASLIELERVPEGSGRDAIRQEILRRAIPKVRQFGMELIDLQIKRVNYENDVRMKVFERMRSERKRAADKYRSQGEAEEARIDGVIEKEMNRIESEAYKQAQILRGTADAEAIKIYADAYSKDPEFYAFMQTLDSYKKTLTKDTTLMLGTDSKYFSYMIEGGE